MQSDTNRTSLNLSNYFPSRYLRLDNFPKNYAKVIRYMKFPVFDDLLYDNN